MRAELTAGLDRPFLARKPDFAARRVSDFAQRFGEAHVLLACHAAFPLALSPDLLYQIRAHFVPEAPWTGVADVLLSGLCDEVGHELYEMDLAVRRILLREIEDRGQAGQQLLNDLSNFMLQYVAEDLDSEDRDLRDLAAMQRWSALAYVKPDLVAAELTRALAGLAPGAEDQVFRYKLLVETLAEPLRMFMPMLQRVRRRAETTVAGVNGSVTAAPPPDEPARAGSDQPNGATESEPLLRQLPAYYSEPDLLLVRRALELAAAAHTGQQRRSGEPYIMHPLAVAVILSELGMDAATVAAGLLHDVVEDTTLTLEILTGLNPDVARIVDGAAKLTSASEMATLPANSRRDPKVESLRMMMLSMIDDVRIVVVKLADRLHNLRTMAFMRPDAQQRISQETMEVYAPLAGVLGIYSVKWELEDLAFRYLEPDSYIEIKAELSRRREEREAYANGAIEVLRPELAKQGVQATISQRPEHIYSVWGEMKRTGITPDKACDRHGLRILVPEVAQCYAALAVVHWLWRPIAGKFDDYVASPKENQYQSLHTAVIGPDGRVIEIQIRTPEMDRVANFGIAAQWPRVSQTPTGVAYERKLGWLRSVLDWSLEGRAAGSEFLSSANEELFKDRVYVFTPRGDVIDLPAGSTPIDFAYRLHTEIGHRCRGAKVRGKLVSLDTPLQSGDQVVILTAKQGGPSRDWLNPHLNFVKTSRARTKIRQWFKQQNREENIAAGRELLARELHRLSIENMTFLEVAGLFGYTNADDFLSDVGMGDVTSADVAQRVLQLNKPEEPLKEAHQEGLPQADRPQKTVTPKVDGAVAVLGTGNLLTVLSRCCNPMPPDDIVGFVTRGRGVSVHRADCPNVLRLDPERMIRVDWGRLISTRSRVRFRIEARDRQGLLEDILAVLDRENIELEDASPVTERRDSRATITATVQVRDAGQLARVLALIAQVPGVADAYRLTD